MAPTQSAAGKCSRGGVFDIARMMENLSLSDGKFSKALESGSIVQQVVSPRDDSQETSSCLSSGAQQAEQRKSSSTVVVASSLLPSILTPPDSPNLVKRSSSSLAAETAAPATQKEARPTLLTLELRPARKASSSGDRRRTGDGPKKHAKGRMTSCQLAKEGHARCWCEECKKGKKKRSSGKQVQSGGGRKGDIAKNQKGPRSELSKTKAKSEGKRRRQKARRERRKAEKREARSGDTLMRDAV